jgi:probable HAF family extracellular repeat protein
MKRSASQWSKTRFLIRPRLEALEQRLLPSYALVDLGTLGGTISSGIAIDGINVVGYSDLKGDKQYHAFRYRDGAILDLGTLGGSDSFASSVAGNLVAGWSSTSGNQFTHAFLDYRGKLTDLGTLGGTFSVANGVDGAGAVAGFATIPGDQATHAFLYNDGVMTDLCTLGGTESEAFGLSSTGEAVGQSTLPGDQVTHAVAWPNGIITDLGTLGGAKSKANAANSSGQVAGVSDTTGVNHDAFLDASGTMTDLGNLGGGFSSALGINDAGAVVGYSFTSMFDSHAFIYTDGVMVDLNNLIRPNSGWDLQEANAISPQGWIVGAGITPNGQTHGVLLIPKTTAASVLGGDASLLTPLLVRMGKQGVETPAQDMSGTQAELLRSPSVEPPADDSLVCPIPEVSGEHQLGSLTQRISDDVFVGSGLGDFLKLTWGDSIV